MGFQGPELRFEPLTRAALGQPSRSLLLGLGCATVAPSHGLRPRTQGTSSPRSHSRSRAPQPLFATPLHESFAMSTLRPRNQACGTAFRAFSFVVWVGRPACGPRPTRRPRPAARGSPAARTRPASPCVRAARVRPPGGRPRSPAAGPPGDGAASSSGPSPRPPAGAAGPPGPAGRRAPTGTGGPRCARACGGGSDAVPVRSRGSGGRPPGRSASRRCATAARRPSRRCWCAGRGPRDGAPRCPPAAAASRPPPSRCGSCRPPARRSRSAGRRTTRACSRPMRCRTFSTRLVAPWRDQALVQRPQSRLEARAGLPRHRPLLLRPLRGRAAQARLAVPLRGEPPVEHDGRLGRRVQGAALAQPVPRGTLGGRRGHAAYEAAEDGGAADRTGPAPRAGTADGAAAWPTGRRARRRPSAGGPAPGSRRRLAAERPPGPQRRPAPARQGDVAAEVAQGALAHPGAAAHGADEALGEVGLLAPGAGAGGGPADEQAPMGAGLGAGVRELQVAMALHLGFHEAGHCKPTTCSAKHAEFGQNRSSLGKLGLGSRGGTLRRPAGHASAHREGRLNAPSPTRSPHAVAGAGRSMSRGSRPPASSPA